MQSIQERINDINTKRRALFARLDIPPDQRHIVHQIAQASVELGEVLAVKHVHDYLTSGDEPL